jgi:hypothetical protein
MSELFPRLDHAIASTLVTTLAESTPEAIAAQAGLSHPSAAPAPTGGIQVREVRLQGIRNDVLDLACSQGFPESSAEGRRAFDADCSMYLAGPAKIPFAEGLRPEVWSFLTLVVLPDVALWRFPGARHERLTGGTRNVFQRLWRRGSYLAVAGSAPDRELLVRLSEDAFTAIFERPGLSASPRLARAICEGWVRSADRIGDSSMEAVHRIALRFLRAVLSVVSLDGLDGAELTALVNRAFTMGEREALASSSGSRAAYEGVADKGE